MFNLFQTPTLAIDTFERWSGLRITVHEVGPLPLRPFLPPTRFFHQYVACELVKHQGHNAECVAFDMEGARMTLAQRDEVLIRCCPAGLVEWVAPVSVAATLTWVLFAGLRTAAPDLQLSERATPLPTPPELPPLPRVTQQESLQISEGLAQLAARLQLWGEKAQRILHADHLPAESNALTQRIRLIHQFILTRHTTHVTLGELAQELNLSESRTAHLVTALCGQSFSELLIEARIRTAATLLQHTNLSILAVAMSSGFSDLAHFSRTFTRHTGLSPRTYRKQLINEYALPRSS